jgi:hypothetical protein
MEYHYWYLCCYHLLCVVLSTSCWLTKVSPGGEQGLHRQSLLPGPRWSTMIQGICKMVLPKCDYSIPILTPFLSSHSCKLTTQQSYSYRGKIRLCNLSEFSINVFIRGFPLDQICFDTHCISQLITLPSFLFHRYYNNNPIQNQGTHDSDSMGTKPGCTTAATFISLYVKQGIE